MATDTYAVVEFVEENAVEVVVKTWIEKINGVGSNSFLQLRLAFL
jgi:hypothetical protein